MSEHELIRPGRIPMTDQEAAALEALLAEHGVTTAHLTRSLPGETGPIIATIDGTEYELEVTP